MSCNHPSEQIGTRRDRITRHGALSSAVLCAFGLLELDGRDLRREPIAKRKAMLAQLLKGQQMSIVPNEVYEEHGAIARARPKRIGGANFDLT